MSQFKFGIVFAAMFCVGLMIASSTIDIPYQSSGGMPFFSNDQTRGNNTNHEKTPEEIFAEKEKKIQKSIGKHQNGSKYYQDEMMTESVGPVSYAGYWAFNEPSGNNADDFTDNANDGTDSGATRSTSGIYGGCFDFDGTNDYINCGTSATLAAGRDSITSEAWVKPDTITGYDRIVTKKWQHYLYLEGGYLAFHISGGTPATILYSPSRLATGTWYHVAGTWDGSTVKVWINGTQVNSASVSGSMNNFAYTCYIGQSEGETRFFDGLIDEVHIGNDALSSTVLSAHAQQKPENAILLNYTFEENTNTAYDQSEFDKDGTFNGNAVDVQNPNGYCVYLDGTGDYVSHTNAYCYQPQEFTLESWIFPISADEHDNIISKPYNTGGQPYYSYGLKIHNDGDITVLNAAGGSNQELRTDSGITFNRWTHVAGTWDGTYLKIYVNGELVKTSSSISGLISYNTNIVTVGSYNGASNYYYGYQDNTKIFHYALSSTQIEAEYNSDPPIKVMNTGKQDWNYYIDDQVNAVSGNLVHAAKTDISVSCRGCGDAMSIDRVYNSANKDVLSYFGYGWTSNYDISLFDGESFVRIYQPDGSFETYLPTSGGNYASPTGVYSNLVLSVNDFKLYYPSGMYCQFDRDGYLTKIVDKSGNNLNFTYTSDLLTQVNDDSGQTLNISYYEDNLISSVTDRMGRSVSYTYASGNLETVTDALDKETRYFYSSDLLIGDVDRIGHIDGFVYDTLSRVSKIKYGEYEEESVTTTYINSLTSRYDITYYLANTTATNARSYKTAIWYNNEGNPTQITDHNGYSEIESWDSNMNLVSHMDKMGYYTNYTYDSRGNLLNVTDAYGNVTRNTWNNHDSPYLSELNSTTDRNGHKTSYYYDSYGNLTGVKDALNKYENYTYNTKGYVTGKTDRNGNAYTYTLNTRGQTTDIEDPTGNDTQYDYDAVGRQTSETDARSHQTSYTYNNNDWVTSTRDAAGGYTNRTYDDEGNLKTDRTPLGQYTNYTYNVSFGKVYQITNPEGETKTYSYDAAGNEIEYTDENNYNYTYTYDYLNRMTVSTDPDSKSDHWTYDKNGMVTNYTDKNDQTTFYYYNHLNWQTMTQTGSDYETYAYDAEGNMLAYKDKNDQYTNRTYTAVNRVNSTTDPQDETETYGYDNNGNMITYKDKNDKYTNMTFNSVNRATSVRDPQGEYENYTYDGVGNVLTYTDKNGATTTYTYDALNVQNSTMDSYGYSEYRVYDKNGNLITFTDKAGKNWTYTYDSMNRLIKATDPNNKNETYGYDAAGNKVNYTNKLDQKITYTYDSLNRMTMITDPLGYYEQYTYDSASNIVNFTDKKGNYTSYSVDSINELIEITSRGGNETEYYYDSNGNLVGIMQGNDSYIEMTYDSLNRLIEKRYYDGEEDAGTYLNNVSYQYDSNGNVKEIDGGNNGKLTSNYDSMNRLLNFTVDYGSFTKTIAYTYDGNGNVLSMTNPDNKKTNYTYDSLNRLIRIQDPECGYFNFSYDQLGRRTNLSYPFGGYLTYSYDSVGNLASIIPHSINIPQIDYTYDAMGKVTTKKTGSSYTNYTYNDRGELTKEKNATTEINYTYDANGNRLTMVSGASTTTYYYDNENKLYSIDPYRSILYDANGNVVDESGIDGVDRYQYQYNIENYLIGVTLPDTSTITYVICPLGKRMAKITSTSTEFYICERDARLLVMNTTGVTQLRYVQNPALIDETLGYKDSNGIHYNYFDSIGSVIAESDSTGNNVLTYTFSAFGNGGVSTSGYGFTGRTKDIETGLYDYRARMYKPEFGRFMSADPIAFKSVPSGGPCGCGCSGGSNKIQYMTNLYDYCGNDPVNYKDPSGKNRPPQPIQWGTLSWDFYKIKISEITKKVFGVKIGIGYRIDLNHKLTEKLAPTKYSTTQIIPFPAPAALASYIIKVISLLLTWTLYTCASGGGRLEISVYGYYPPAFGNTLFRCKYSDI
ncbi:MAG: DUF6531 domain-containing protein [Candidatus Nanoarchaeia archaeon]|nr:DUF6531 domain-containing protein [Candidatus Nanoarchaeia archaeon]